MRLYYVHDPMCSWCWAYRPVLDALRLELPRELDYSNLLGGLARDTEEPMPMAMRETIEGYWRQIVAEVGAEFNFDFWRDPAITPRRATYPACRAVIAAAWQGGEESMILALQHAYYRRCMNPSDTETLLQLAVEQGLDVPRFQADLCGDAVNDELRRQVKLSRQLPLRGFPSWVLDTGSALHCLPLDYHCKQPTLDAIHQLSA